MVVSEPWLDDRPWLSALANRTVLVVHPFNNSIKAQLAKGSRALWGKAAERVMPTSTRFKLLRPPVNFLNGNEFKRWRPAYDELVRRVDAAGDFDVAMVSCGGLGMLLCHYLRETNRSCIYMGGSLQIWFGILGLRWVGFARKDARLAAVIKNPSWVHPLKSEFPPSYTRLERGAYY